MSKDKDKKINKTEDITDNNHVNEQAENDLNKGKKVDLPEKSKEELAAEITDLTAKLKKAEEDVSAAKQDAEKFQDNWYRAVAEYENYKKRMADVRKNSYDDGIKDAITNILSIGDSVDRALSMELDEKTRHGVELISRQFTEALAAISVNKIDPIRQAFDPSNSEAIATLPAKSDEDDGKVVQVYKKGYEMRGKILRYAQVVVGKKE